ncbi:hypothetical protein CN907_01580 [Bacillus anthracis]|nr:hypothetical protein CN907_01580 [Bacillus anthracis]
MQVQQTATKVVKTQKDRSGLAITSLVLGIISAVFFVLAVILLIFDLVASAQYSNTIASLYYKRDDTVAMVGIICFIISGLIGVISFPMGVRAKKTSKGRGMAVAATVLSFFPMGLFYLAIIGIILILYLESKNELKSINNEDVFQVTSVVDENKVKSNSPEAGTTKTIDDGVNTLFGFLTKQECTQNDDQKVTCYILELSTPINLVPSKDVLEELVFDKKHLNNITEVELGDDARLQNYINKQVTVKGQIIVPQTGGWHRYVGMDVDTIK